MKTVLVCDCIRDDGKPDPSCRSYAQCFAREPEPNAMLNFSHWLVMKLVYAHKQIDLRRYSERVRQRAIDLAMHEPAYIDIDADRIFLTDAGKEALVARETAARV